MKEIQLTQGKVAVVDDEDHEYLNQWKWHVIKSKENLWYAVRTNPKSERKLGKVKQARMHREILKISDGKILVDHRDWDGLNNQKVNLRICDKSQNATNCKKKKQPNSHSPYLGVFLYKTSYKRKTGDKSEKFWVRWGAQIRVNNKVIGLGLFPYTKEGEVSASRAYIEASVKYHGEFSRPEQSA